MKALVTGGEAPSSIPSCAYSYIVACDSGYDTARRLGLKPDDVVGDLDSSAFRDELVSLGIRPCSHDKDESDTELGLRLLGGDEWDLIGGGGGRLDHLACLMGLFTRYRAPRRWYTSTDVLMPLEGSLELELPTDTDISVFTFSGSCHVDAASLKWPLRHFLLDGSSLSLSNRTVDERFSISCDGRAWIRLPLAAAWHLA